MALLRDEPPSMRRSAQVELKSRLRASAVCVGLNRERQSFSKNTCSERVNTLTTGSADNAERSKSHASQRICQSVYPAAL